jgi:hypothetical protein
MIERGEHARKKTGKVLDVALLSYVYATNPSPMARNSFGRPRKAA